MIEAAQFPVADVLGDKFLHKIPVYQRPYAWQPEDAEQLVEDIIEARHASGVEPYFLGSIVLIREPDSISAWVVDGQQRLTTLTILAAVLRDITNDHKEHQAISRAVYIEPNEYLAQTEAVRLIASDDDNIFFRDAIQMPGATAKGEPPHIPGTDAQKLMWANAQALRARLLGLDPVERQELVKYLLNKCVIVVVQTKSRAAALRIFRVLNDRGVDLTNADVIKADVLDKLGPDLMSEFAKRWRQFETDLGREDFENLLESLRFIREKGKNRRTLSEAYSERFKSVSPAEVKTFFADELTPAKKRYEQIVDSNVETFPPELRASASESFAGLNLLPNKDWIPTGLAVLLSSLAPAKLVASLEQLEALAWTMQLARRYDTQRMNHYADVIRALSVSEDALATAFKATDEELVDAKAALSGPLYNRFPTRVVRAILERLDRLIAEQPVVWPGQKTVEHILPQQPADEHWSAFSKEDRQTITDTLGNLVLLTARKNSSASNLPYEKKKEVYFGIGVSQASGKKRATYASAQELAHISEWTPANYESRQKRHVKLLADRWRLGAIDKR